MKPSASQNSERWIDPDDAPEITADDLKLGVWGINGKIVSEGEGRDAFASRLKPIAEAEKDVSSNAEQEKPTSGSQI